MVQSTSKAGQIWFWVGVVLLSISALIWLIIILLVVSVHDGVGIAIGITLAVMPIGIGTYGVWRGSKYKSSEEKATVRSLSAEASEDLIYERKLTISALKAHRFSRLSWLIVIGLPILWIASLIVFAILGLPPIIVILDLIVTLFIALLLIGYASKKQANYHKESSRSNLPVEEHKDHTNTESKK